MSYEGFKVDYKYNCNSTRNLIKKAFTDAWFEWVIISLKDIMEWE